jgi:sugar phosphate isomerase/epimerase
MKFDRFNDGTQNAPRLRLGQTLWGMTELPLNAKHGGTEWTLDEKFARCREAGFECVECWLTDENEAEVKAALDRYGLKLILGHRPFSVDDVRQTVQRAVRLDADFVFAQPASAYHTLEETLQIVTEGRKIANDAGKPFFVETHRNNFTETIRQTKELLTAAPDVRITGDFSHFVVVGEFYGWPDEDAIGKMDTILQRVSHLHGRISNGEAVQVDVGDGDNQTAQFFVQMWARAMKYWRANAQPGDVLQFSSELGPPRYAITTPDGREFSDRWQQALVLQKLAQQAWQQSAA